MQDPYESFLEPEPEETQPTAPVPVREVMAEPPRRAQMPQPPKPQLPPKEGRRGCSPGCFRFFILAALLFVAYLFAPFRNNLLVMGIDRAPEGTAIGRSDTLILLSVQPLNGNLRMLSIPRDLWVAIPGYGESRINAAHAFGEAAQPGSGPQVALQTVESNFGVNVSYYMRIRLEGFAAIVDALGGVTITLNESAAGYPPGTYTLNGEQALAFVRDRTGDDFFRMQHGQLFVLAMTRKMLNPLAWIRIPGAMIALAQAVDTNLPLWLWPRFAFATLRAILFDSIDARTLPREAITPWVTDLGAQVLLPNWELIRPLLREMFGLF